MATSSLYKTFYLTGKEETRNFVAMLDNASAPSSASRKIVETKKVSANEWTNLVNATKRNGK